MNIHLPFFHRKPSHTEVRYVVPTARELTEAKRQILNRRASINGQLAVYSATTTLAQRKADAEAYFAKAMTLQVKTR